MRRILSVILAICAVLSFSSCKKQKEKFTRSSLTLFDTQSVLIGYESKKEEFEKTADMVFELLETYHRLFDIYYEYEDMNNLKTVNDNAGIAPVKVDREIIDMLLFSREMYEKTGGMINVAMGSVLSLWHHHRTIALSDEENASVPDKAELEKRAAHTDIDKLIIDTENETVYLKDKEMSLDVGAVAKGYATEKAAKLLESRQKEGYALSIGGNVRCIGEKTPGEKWEVGVQNPDLSSSEAYVALLALSDMSLVTSGTYQRYFTVNGVKYHHIIDPETLFPKNAYASVSVLTKDSGIADALSTALFNMTEEKGRALVEKMTDVSVAWVYPDGTVSMTEGFEKLLSQ